MPAPGDLIQADDYAFAFRRLEPLPDAPRALLVLLHGVGGDEDQLAALGARAPAGTVVVLARGHRSISGGKWGWYRVGFSENGPQVVEDEMHEARRRLLEFLAQLQRHHDIAPARTWVAGFSQGGILAATLALTAPEAMGGFVMMSGRLLPEVDALVATPQRLHHLRALITHGRDDGTLPVAGAREAASRLQRLGLPHSLQLYDAAHELTTAMQDDVACWLQAELARRA